MKKLLLFSFLLIVILNSFGQTSPWTVLAQTQVNQLPSFGFSEMPRTGNKVFCLDLSVLNAPLADVSVDSAADSGVMVNFPNIHGGQDSYNIFEVAILEQARAKNYSIIKSYIEKTINDKKPKQFSLVLHHLG